MASRSRGWQRECSEMEPVEWVPSALVLLVVLIFISSTWSDVANMRHHSQATVPAAEEEKKDE